MLEEVIAVIQSIGVTFVKLLPVSIALGAAFAILSFFWACNPGQPWWRKRGLVTDVCYWFIIPLFGRYLRIGLLVIGAAVLFGINTPEALVQFYDDGHGPLAQLPLWVQAAIFLVTRGVAQLRKLAQFFKVVTNVRQASVSDEIGIVCLEVDGPRQEIKAAIKWLEKQGVKVEPVEINVIES